MLDGAVFAVHADRLVVLEYLIFHEGQLLGHVHRLGLVLDKALAHLLVDRLAQRDLVVGLLKLFLEVLDFRVLCIDFLLKFHVLVAHAVLLCLRLRQFILNFLFLGYEYFFLFTQVFDAFLLLIKQLLLHVNDFALLLFDNSLKIFNLLLQIIFLSLDSVAFHLRHLLLQIHLTLLLAELVFQFGNLTSQFTLISAYNLDA